MSAQEMMSVHSLNRQMVYLSLAERLVLIAENYKQAIFTTSLGEEDQMLTATIGNANLDIDIVTLNTGRLFPETIELLDQTQKHFSVNIKEYSPLNSDVDAYISEHGKDGFYNSLTARLSCCHIRKVIPLQKALNSASAWISGLRREQSQNRVDIPFAEWSDDYQLVKFNPLADWSREQLLEAIAKENIPINPLHGRGYPSIGCAPCTRAIKPGEHERAGRWWWENENHQECGLHLSHEDAAS